MNAKEAFLCVASFAALAVSFYAYFYESRYAGLLPVVTYPLRQYALPVATVGFVLLIVALLVRKTSSKAHGKTSTAAVGLRFFALVFLIVGFVMKMVGEMVHELLGHGCFVLLLGGEVTGFHISLLWPFELSYINWVLPNETPYQTALILGAGILVSSILSFSIQLLLLWRDFRWRSSTLLFWLAFWCYINATGYLIVGAVSPFGDLAQLFQLGVLNPVLSASIGLTLFIVGFFALSEILRRIFTPFLDYRTRWAILAFWCIIPVLVGLTIAGRGAPYFPLLALSVIPILASYVLEFQIRGRVHVDDF